MPTLADFLSPEHIVWTKAKEKTAALGQLLGTLASSSHVKDPRQLEAAILEREVMMSTGVGYGVAVPHAKIPAVDCFMLALGISADGIPYGSVVDDQPVRLICMIAGPDSAQTTYLKLLSAVMKFVKSEKGRLLAARHPDEIRRVAQNYPVAVE
jgi:mannitol/fructose-specific phosphotransferase system IIA component (Ntr-type)